VEGLVLAGHMQNLKVIVEQSALNACGESVIVFHQN